MGRQNLVKLPREQFDEIVAGRGEIVEWLKLPENRDALLLAEEAAPALVAQVVSNGYAVDLNEDEVEELGLDPFLIAYALVAIGERTVVTFERSSPAKQRANRKIPDVCASFGVPSCTLYEMRDALDFRMDWRP